MAAQQQRLAAVASDLANANTIGYEHVRDCERIGTDDPAVRASGELSGFSCNLRAPIVVWNGRGHQVINEAPGAPVRAPLFPDAATVHAA